MRISRLLTSSAALTREFARCANTFPRLDIAVAWAADPIRIPSFDRLSAFSGQIHAILGISYDRTDPAAIQWFMDNASGIRIFRTNRRLFHPKLYLFRDPTRFALIVGSSNFTFGGFESNLEANILVEGTLSSRGNRDIRQLVTLLERWRQKKYSFKPTSAWLRDYADRYDEGPRHRNAKPTPEGDDDAAATSNWLKTADWPTYMHVVTACLERAGRTTSDYHRVLDASETRLPIPWCDAFFADIGKRRVMGGMGTYGLLGNVAASGRLRRLLARGSKIDHHAIAIAVNKAASFSVPLPWKALTKQLRGLTAIGPTMKVWGRFLCITRPDLYCTVSAPWVRKKLSHALSIPQSQLETPDGYVELLRYIHKSPWFNSPRPRRGDDRAIWRRRVAFVDAAFY